MKNGDHANATPVDRSPDLGSDEIPADLTTDIGIIGTTDDPETTIAAGYRAARAIRRLPTAGQLKAQAELRAALESKHGKVGGLTLLRAFTDLALKV